MASLIDDGYEGGDSSSNDDKADSEGPNFPDGDLTVERPGDDGDVDYTEQVIKQFNEYVEQARTEDPSRSSADLAERAYLLAELAREADKNSTDTFARDVEHYALGVNSAASRDYFMIGCSVGGAFVYDGLKAVALGLKRDGFPALADFMRSGNRPISEPSWRVDSIRGVFDGLTTDFSKSQKWYDKKSNDPQLLK